MLQQRIKTGEKSKQYDDWDQVHNQLIEIQKKSLEVSKPGDPEEEEADKIARKVVNGEGAVIGAGSGGINRKGEAGVSKVHRQTKVKKAAPKPYIIEKIVGKEIASYTLFHMTKENAVVVKTETFPKVQFEQEVKIGPEYNGTYYVLFRDEMGKVAGGQKVHPDGEKEIILKTMTEDTYMTHQYPNYLDVKQQMKDWETKEPSFKGRMYLHKMGSNETLDGLVDSTLKNNTTSRARLFDKIVNKLNPAGSSNRKIGNAAILLRGWIDPNIGTTLPAKPDPKNLTEDQKALIATIYGEMHGTSTAAIEQQKYIWYSFLLRVKSPDHSADVYAVLKSGAYQAYQGNKAYTDAKKMLDDGIPDAGVTAATNVVVNNWNLTTPSDAGLQYVHWFEKISQHYAGYVKGTTEADDTKENAAVYKFLKAQKWNTTGLSETKAWKKRIRITDKKLEGTMYVFN